MPYKDPEAQRAYQRRYQSDYQKKRYQQRREELVALLGGSCVRCGSSDELEFDHRDPSTKSFAIMSRWNEPLENLADELAKCQLLCFTCHRKKTYPRFDT